MEPRLCGSAQIIAACPPLGKRRTATLVVMTGKWRWIGDLQGKKNPR
jgi:hypothetical protein